MAHLLNIYRANLQKSTAVWLQYRVAALIWLVGSIMQPTVYLVVWVTVAQSQGGSVEGYDVAGFAAYFIATMYVDFLTFTWIMWEYDYRVREGTMSRMLLLPVHPIHEDIADNLVYKAFGMLVLIPVGFVMAWTFSPTFDLQPWAVAMFIPSLLIAFVMRFLIGWTLALAAFWTTRIAALNRMYFVMQLFFSGRLTPLALLPAPLLLLANALPFKWFIYFPVELLLGRVSQTEALQGIGMQLLWLAASVVAVRFFWARGVKKYAAFGS